jgi:hypothetical protein
MVSMIDYANDISDKSTLTTESVARKMCISGLDSAIYVDSVVDTCAQSIERDICERCNTSALTGEHHLFCRQCLG